MATHEGLQPIWDADLERIRDLSVALREFQAARSTSNAATATLTEWVNATTPDVIALICDELLDRRQERREGR